MTPSPLVSIIIPTYNRAHLIGETLDSVIAQTYQNWECIVVDDGSTDNTAEVLAEYVAKDSRIQFHHRPPEHKSGGNGARNYGFKLSKGEYVQWFDSDDLMHREKIEKKINRIIKDKLDLVISKTKYFNKENISFRNYEFKDSEVSFDTYTMKHIRWLTPDMLLERKKCKEIKFNEELKAGQEAFYIYELLLHPLKIGKIDEFLCFQRYSSDSIQGKRDLDKVLHRQRMIDFYWPCYLQIALPNQKSEFARFCLKQITKAYMKSDFKSRLPKGYRSRVLSEFGWRSVFIPMAFISYGITKKYDRFFNWLS